ncbi:hypothetical protein [Comamonas aquatica]|uniref:AbiU2 domain-containing protein n=1 Tax=Comamonas aquatica TaxID=225991 RepID=UPI001B37D643|nr:hypothetical protein [Comamonas aquatica]QTX21570.1 hypothetical protein KAQ61_03445 [Comamonas aquatica]
MSTPAAPSASAILDVINKEITGIQLLWEAVNGMYFRAASRPGIEALADDVPALYRLMQTAMMESLLIRIARLMDPSVSGRGEGHKPNLSLARLVEQQESLKGICDGLKAQWSTSALESVRNKYLSHNDLGRSQSEEHTLNIPLTGDDVVTVENMVVALREFRVAANREILQSTHLDAGLIQQIARECETINDSLRAGNVLFNLLSDHAFLQKAWTDTEAADAIRNKPC